MISDVESSSTTLVCRSDDLLSTGVAEETVLLDATNWIYIHLNETAARIWETLDEPRSIDDIVETLQRGYAVDRETCLRAVEAFVDDMSARGFIFRNHAAA